MSHFQDERLAKFVVGSHIRHHPNEVDNEDSAQVTIKPGFYFHLAVRVQNGCFNTLLEMDLDIYTTKFEIV